MSEADVEGPDPELVASIHSTPFCEIFLGDRVDQPKSDDFKSKPQ